MNTSRSAAGFPAMFTNLVAEASAKLPPLTKPEHFAFLSEVQDMVIAGFWERYAAGCSAEAQAAIKAAMEKQDFAAVQEWYKAHASFASDPAAAKRADTILDEMAATVASMIEESYREEFAES